VSEEEPQAVREGRELLDLNFFPNTGEDRYLRAEDFRENAIRLIIFDLHLAIEDLLKSALYERIAEHSVLDADNDIAYVKAMKSGELIDLSARLGVISIERHGELVELNGLRNRVGHTWALDVPELGPKGPKRGRYALRWKGGRLTPKRVRKDLLPLYGGIYLDLYLSYLDRSDTPEDPEVEVERQG
jgi:hypothetical protein